MSRWVVNAGRNGEQVVIVYEEGEKAKRVKREQVGYYSLAEMNQTSDGSYEYANKKIEYLEGGKESEHI